MLQALEELAMNYDLKTHEIDQKTREVDDLQEQLTQKVSAVRTKDGELQQLRDNYTSQKKKYTGACFEVELRVLPTNPDAPLSAEMMNSLLKDLGDVGESLSEQLAKPSFAGAEKLDEEFTVMRLYISKMKTEAKSLHSRVRSLEGDRSAANENARKCETETKELRVLVQELEVKNRTLNSKVEETEERKRKLEEALDEVNAEVAKLRANEQVCWTFKFDEVTSHGDADSWIAVFSLGFLPVSERLSSVCRFCLALPLATKNRTARSWLGKRTSNRSWTKNSSVRLISTRSN